MEILVSELGKSHPVVKASHRMVEVHRCHETLLPAVEEVAEEFPELTTNQLTLLWIGVNAKDLDG